jgi:hypothetical protein
VLVALGVALLLWWLPGDDTSRLNETTITPAVAAPPPVAVVETLPTIPEHSEIAVGTAAVRFFDSCSGTVVLPSHVQAIDERGGALPGEPTANGWSFQVLEGSVLPVTLTHADPLYFPLEVNFELVAGEIHDLTVYPACEVSGFVEDREGRNIAGIEVAVVSPATGTVHGFTTTNSNGDFVLVDIPRGSFDLRCGGPGWATSLLPIRVGCSGLLMEEPIVLDRGFELEIVVSSTWVGEVLVSVSEGSDLRSSSKGDPSQKYASEWGQLNPQEWMLPGTSKVLRGLRGDCYYSVRGQTQDGSTVQFGYVLEKGAVEEKKGRSTVLLEPGGASSVIVTLQFEEPVEVLPEQLSLVLFPQQLKGCITKIDFDSSGQLIFEGLSEGYCDIWLNHNGIPGLKDWRKEVQLVGGREPLRIEIPIRAETESLQKPPPSDLIEATVAQRWLGKPLWVYLVETNSRRMVAICGVTSDNSSEWTPLFQARPGFIEEHLDVYASVELGMESVFWKGRAHLAADDGGGRSATVVLGDASWQEVGDWIELSGKIVDPSTSLMEGTAEISARGPLGPVSLTRTQTDGSGRFLVELPPVGPLELSFQWKHNSGQQRHQFHYLTNGLDEDLGELVATDSGQPR